MVGEGGGGVVGKGSILSFMFPFWPPLYPGSRQVLNSNFLGFYFLFCWVGKDSNCFDIDTRRSFCKTSIGKISRNRLLVYRVYLYVHC